MQAVSLALEESDFVDEDSDPRPGPWGDVGEPVGPLSRGLG